MARLTLALLQKSDGQKKRVPPNKPMTNTQTKPKTHLELLREYKYFKAIPSEELIAAQATIPQGQSAIACFIEASKKYQEELKEEARNTRVRPSVCCQLDDCDEDHCRCWK